MPDSTLYRKIGEYSNGDLLVAAELFFKAQAGEGPHTSKIEVR
jgi:hypothetical protein